MATYQADFYGHPENPEEFCFTQTRFRDKRTVRVVRSFVSYDDQWSPWRKWVVARLDYLIRAFAKIESQLP